MLFLANYQISHANIVVEDIWPITTPQNISELIQIESRLQKLLPESQKALVAIEAIDGAGSGVIISEDGLVLTAAHVIGETGKKMHVRLPNGQKLPAISLGGSEISDAGMLKITKKGKWPFAQIASKGDSEIGDWCFAIGHPGGFEKDRGIVVRLGRVIAKSEETLQSDSRLLGGDSGGPLFDFHGKVIAIHSRISHQPDQNFHVPIECFHTNWNFYRNGEILTFDKLEKGGFLGVACESTNFGLKVLSVVEGSAAEKAGIKKGDFLISIDGEKLDSREELTILISSKNSEDPVILEYHRNDKQISIQVNLGLRAQVEKEHP